ncbi:MAG: 3-hydroxyacyl-ACP dehydratase FabZ family protein [Planctomycetota bacterium]
MSLEKIHAAIPHRPPFLLIDEVIEQSDERIVCGKKFTGEEFWYQGHYPDYPLTPGVLLCEASLQAAAVLLSDITKREQAGETPGGVPVATRLNNVQFRAMVHPGDSIKIECDLTERLAKAYFMRAKVTNATTGKLAARLELACTVTAPQQG